MPLFLVIILEALLLLAFMLIEHVEAAGPVVLNLKVVVSVETARRAVSAAAMVVESHL